MRRRKLRAQKKSKKQDIISYKAGSFGLSSAPEDITGIQSGSVVPILNDKKKQLLKRKKSTNFDIIEKNIEVILYISTHLVTFLFFPHCYTKT